MNQNEKEAVVRLLCTSEPENIALAKALCHSQNYAFKKILLEFGYWDIGIRFAERFICCAHFEHDILNCNFLGLKKLTDLLPAKLKELKCCGNKLTTLPPLPAELKELDCAENQLAILPALPETLEILYCQYNQLCALPILPNMLKKLSCNDNQLTDLPNLPTNLEELQCECNQLSDLPDLPKKLNFLIGVQNPIKNKAKIKARAPKKCLIRI
jgi:hypothetical protein